MHDLWAVTFSRLLPIDGRAQTKLCADRLVVCSTVVYVVARGVCIDFSDDVTPCVNVAVAVRHIRDVIAAARTIYRPRSLSRIFYKFIHVIVTVICI